MKIIIASNIYPPEVGGPSHYTKLLNDGFIKKGHQVQVIKFSDLKKFPSGLRHLLYFFRLFKNTIRSDVILSMDTFSVGFPSALVSRILRKKSFVRVGGDFLWEMFVERTKEDILLSEFYISENIKRTNLKERVILILTKWSLKSFSKIIFSTKWQRDIWQEAYNLDISRTYVVKNHFPNKKPLPDNFNSRTKILFAGRNIYLKNLKKLKEIFASGNLNKDIFEVCIDLDQFELHKKIENSRAVIVPSLSEVSPNIILESISLNTPFILTRDTGLYEEFHKFGVFIKPKDIKDIEDKIRYILDENNYKNIMEIFKSSTYNSRSYEEIADDFLNIFNKKL